MGAVSMTGNFGSFLRTSKRVARDFEVLSRLDVLTAAVYWIRHSSQFPCIVTLLKQSRFGGMRLVSYNAPEHLHMSRLGRIEALGASSSGLGLLERRSGVMEIQWKLACNWIVR